MMAVLRPLDLKPVVPSLAEATGRGEGSHAPSREQAVARGGRFLASTSTGLHVGVSHGAIASVVAVVVGLAVMSVAGHKGEGEAPRLGHADASPPAAGATPDVEKAVIATSRETPPKAPDSSADESDATADRTEADPIRPRGSPARSHSRSWASRSTAGLMTGPATCRNTPFATSSSVTRVTTRPKRSKAAIRRLLHGWLRPRSWHALSGSRGPRCGQRRACE